MGEPVAVTAAGVIKAVTWLPPKKNRYIENEFENKCRDEQQPPSPSCRSRRKTKITPTAPLNKSEKALFASHAHLRRRCGVFDCVRASDGEVLRAR
jgi:hypothetical protein